MRIKGFVTGALFLGCCALAACEDVPFSQNYYGGEDENARAWQQGFNDALGGKGPLTSAEHSVRTEGTEIYEKGYQEGVHFKNYPQSPRPTNPFTPATVPGNSPPSASGGG